VTKRTTHPPFKSFRFGKTSAEKESVEWPDLLTRGYFDPHGLIEVARQRGPFLFLGYKGSGKSAIGEHLCLTAAEDPQSFVHYVSIGDFPYTPFS
jgi:SpoVK/Ycf46/Vps4 family AAA+-type ATPase